MLDEQAHSQAILPKAAAVVALVPLEATEMQLEVGVATAALELHHPLLVLQ
jgi:hypothetical protein